jgi:hypothetical protein
MDKLDRAVKRLTDDWPANPFWIYTTPDNGKNVYRAMRTDVCPEEFLDYTGQPMRQLFSVDGKIVACDSDYGIKEKK